MEAITLTSSLWSANTACRLCSVPWDSNYRDIVAWDSASQREGYFNALPSGESWVNTRMRYLKPGEPIRVPVPYSSAYRYNYCVVTNPAQPVSDEGPLRSYYYFITDTRYLNPQTTELTLQLDVVTTYGLEMRLGDMFVEAGHIGVSNAACDIAADPYAMLEYLDTPEGLDVGSEYVVAGQRFFGCNGTTDSSGDSPDYLFIMSTADLESDPGTVENPSLNTAGGGSVSGMVSGMGAYYLRYDDAEKFFTACKRYSWIAQCIVLCMAVPNRMVEAEYLNFNVQLFGKTDVMLSRTSGHAVPHIDGFGKWEGIAEAAKSLMPPAMRKFSKLLSYPYTVYELTGFNGANVFLKPQYLFGADLVLNAEMCQMAQMAKMAIYPRDYGGITPDTRFSVRGDASGVIAGGQYLDTALWLSDFPQFPIVNNSYITYLASTANTRSYQYGAAGWANAKSNMSATLAYNQGNDRLGTAAQNQALGMSLANMQNSVAAGKGAASAVGQLAGGNIGGALATGANTAADYGMNALALSNQQAQFANTQGLGYRMNDENYRLAQTVAQGDYRQAVAAINATVQDAALTPPSVTGQLGGNGFNWQHGLYGCCIRIKQISGAALAVVANFFARYGYRVQRFINLSGKKLSDLKVMSKASYWKVAETYITCAYANETEKDALRGVLEKGVTVWNDPDDIGNIDFVRDNEPLYNIRY